MRANHQLLFDVARTAAARDQSYKRIGHGQVSTLYKLQRGFNIRYQLTLMCNDDMHRSNNRCAPSATARRSDYRARKRDEPVTLSNGGLGGFSGRSIG